MSTKETRQSASHAKFIAALGILAAALPARQLVTHSGLTMQQAVADALKNYPSIRVSQEEINAAAEVLGNLEAGDRVVRRATDEIREGAPIQTPSK